MRISSLLTASFVLAGSALAAEPTPEQAAFFESKIRPILTEKCYKCHSVETGKSKGGLTLDTRDGLLKGGDSGPGLKPGNVDASLLIKAVLYTDKDLQMPPKGEKLSDKQIADLTSWVKMGAPDPRTKAKGSKLSGLTDKAKQHWAFQPIKKPEVPAVKNRAWCITPVDAFVMQKLEEKRMAPSPGLMDQPGGKETLLRRATYDLTGLPPTPQEIREFIADQTPYAFAKVVDRLLAAPAYGERWGRFWLDTARYSDTTGERGNRGEDYRYPYAWTYRDWVINAFNTDLPYDQFVIQQLAADKIKDNPKTNLAALGFLTVGEKFRNVNDVINDRIDTTSKAFIGLTVACARCHDHMFDPIPTKDYYALHGVFASTVEPAELPILSASLDPKMKADYDTKVAAAEKVNRDKYYKLIAEESAKFRAKAGTYLLAAYYRKNGMSEGDQQKAEKIIKAENLDVPLLNESRRYMRAGNEVFGAFLRFAEGGLSSSKKTADEIAADSRVNPLIAAAFKGTAPKSLDEVAAIYNKVFASTDSKAAALRANYESAMSASESISLDKNTAEVAFAPFPIRPALDLNTETLRSEAQKWVIQIQGKARFDFAKINELELTDKGAAARAMAVVDSPNPHDSPVFIRGQAGVTGDLVSRHAPEVISNGKPEPFKDGSGRLELAQAIANKSNPLTARVIVNRVWMHHFGAAFVRTPDDLGTQSEAPSHQELLDYLASYFMDQGWSFKKLHKLIMLSKVYQESSYTVKAHETMDPENRLLWRANVRRLDFEAFRDSLLVMSGRLDRTLGGQPVNLTDEPYSYRRSVYGYVDRGNLPELMQNFDFARPDMPNSSRTSTIVPQQALFLMNNAMVIDVSRRILVQPSFLQAGADFKRVDEVYLIVYGRHARPEEIQMATKFMSEEVRKQADVVAKMKEITAKAQANAEKKTADLAKSSNATKAIQNVGDVIERKPLNPWETFAQALLFSNEACYIN